MRLTQLSRRALALVALLALVVIGSTGCGMVTALRDTQMVTVYFDNRDLNPDAVCDQVFPVERRVPEDADPVQAALEELFAGPTAAEAGRGYSSFFSEETRDMLLGLKVDGDTAYVNLADVRKVIPGASSSCGRQALLAALDNTVMAAQPDVERVIYAIEGDPATFYQWIQLGCGQFNDDCDPTPFQQMG